MKLLYLVLIPLAFFYLTIKVCLGYWKRRGILHEKPKFLWGNIKDVAAGRKHIQQILQQLYESYKGRAPFIGFYAGIKPFVFVLDLDLVRQILVTNSGCFTSRGLYSNVQAEPLSGNLLQLDGHSWRDLHARNSSVLTAFNMQKLLPQLLEVAVRYQHTFVSQQISQQDGQQDGRQIVNISQLVDGYNMHVVSSLIVGLNEDVPMELCNMTRTYWNDFSLWKAYLCLEFPLLARLLQQKSYADEATEYFEKLMLGQLEEQHRLKRNNMQQLDNFLSLYIDAENPLNDLQIAAQCFGFILASLVPLNATLCFCLYELALKPDLQQLVRNEIEAVLKQHNGQLTPESLNELKYSKLVLKETLRLHSPYPFLLRRATKSFEIPKSVFMIARGNNIIIPTAAIHRDPVIYDEPLRFDPLRFKDNNSTNKQTRPDMAYLPFGAGLRGCIAMQFAESQLLVGLVTLLQPYRYEPYHDTLIPMQYDNGRLLLTPKKDIYLKAISMASCET